MASDANALFCPKQTDIGENNRSARFPRLLMSNEISKECAMKIRNGYLRMRVSAENVQSYIK